VDAKLSNLQAAPHKAAFGRCNRLLVQLDMGEMMTFYTYLWLREDGTPYYVGKGKDDRAYTSDGRRVHKPSSERILVQEFPSEADAFAAEKFLISYYGRLDLGTGCLRNLTAGGEGTSGIIRSQEFRKRVGDRNRATMWSEERRKKQGISQRKRFALRGHPKKGVHLSESAKQDIRIRQLGHSVSEETRQRISLAKRMR
jgi:hypothetical protein